MKNGYFDGFARQFEAQGESHIDDGSSDKVVAVSSCKVGFWSPLRVYSSEKGKGQFITLTRPHGKWIWLTAKAPDDIQPICPEGIYSAV